MQSDYQFEPVYIDWSGLRTQMIIGWLAIFCLCLVNFIPFWQLKNYDLVNLFPDFTPYFPYCSFTLYFASCSLVALTTLAIGRSAGNRNGAACAIWAALIFAVLPWRTIAFLTDIGIATIPIVFCILLSILALLNSRQIRDIFLSFAFLLFTAGFLLNDANHYGSCIGGSGVELIPDSQPFIWFIWGSGIIFGFNLCWRLIAHSISWITAGKLVFCLWAGYTFAQSLCPSFIVLGSAALAIAISLICLPTLGAASARTNAGYSSLGLIVLVLLAVAYEYWFTGHSLLISPY